MTRGKRALRLGAPKERALLGVLLLHANELVPRERLIEELWGEAAPAQASSSLSVYVSKLRRLLADGTGEEVLATVAPGYVLRVPAESLDARRFEQLLEQGRRALANGDPEGAASTLRDALALWRGSPLADLTYERFAQGEIARLEELRLTALEERIEADLALGRHDGLVAELEALVAAHPYRERLQAQLMLALYRSGRQAEALDAYRRARRTHVDELGIEPGPRLQELERAILRHDKSLEAPAAPASDAPEAAGSRKRRRVPALLAGLVLLLVAAAGTALWATRDASTERQKPVVLAGNSVGVIDPKANAIVDEIPVGGRPTGIALGEGSVWVGNRDDDTLLRIDPSTREVVRTMGLKGEPWQLAVGAEHVWVATPSAVLQVDPDVNDVVATIPWPRGEPTCDTPERCPWSGIAAGPGGAWVVQALSLYRIDPQTHAVRLLRAGDLRYTVYREGALWATAGPFKADWIEKIDPRTGRVITRIDLEGMGTTDAGLGGVAVGEGAVWTGKDEAVWKIDATTGRLTKIIPVGSRLTGAAPGAGALWLASLPWSVMSGKGLVGTKGGVLRVDPTTGRVTKTIPLGVLPIPAVFSNAIAVGEGAVWVATVSP